jgi:cellulose synthase/poly-beta-1,6-N-acetylglucosamine synthase-like glycosyltransferase
MRAGISFVLTVLAGLLAVPVAVFVAEVLAAIVLPKRKSVDTLPAPIRPRLAVLIPAHNESTGLIPTIEDVRSQLRTGDRLLVVADNCSDDTASVARARGAEVVERTDPDKRGKGYALDWGLQQLSANPPSIVVVIDADCRLSADALDRLAAVCERTRRPAQALDLMIAQRGSSINYQVAEFAWRVKNWVRPLGLQSLGLPCQLMGTGMAFPWEVIRSARLASGEIVEDLKLGLELALAGTPAEFCPAALVSSQFPSAIEAVSSQRQRWEHGHIGLILATAPRLIGAALSKRNWPALALAADLCVPPLALLVLLAGITLFLSLITAAVGWSVVPLTISAVTLAAITVAVMLAWWSFGREILSTKALLRIPLYILSKLGLYGQLMTRRAVTRWVRTDRTRR